MGGLLSIAERFRLRNVSHVGDQYVRYEDNHRDVGTRSAGLGGEFRRKIRIKCNSRLKSLSRR